MQITFIRHLPTDWNKKARLQGRRDITISPVTKSDIEDIQKNKRHLDRLAPFDHILSSTLKRTQETANLYGYSPEVDHLLDELDFGIFEGASKNKLAEELGMDWVEDPISVTLGEPVFELEQRIISFIHKYRVADNILAFGHGAWLRGALSYMKYGTINQMNKMVVKNNECFTIQVPP